MAWDTINPNSAWSQASPVLVVGILVFIMPYFNGIYGIHVPGWLSWVGGIIIFLGIIHSITRMR